MTAPKPIWRYQDKAVLPPILAMVVAGISVIPINPKNKRPYVLWKAFQSEPPTKADAFGWYKKFGKECAIGLVTGPVNGWVVVDVDDEKDREWAEATFPPTPVKQRTARGIHYFYRQGKRTIPNRTKIDRREVDIRGTGGLVIIAPSVIQGHSRRFEIDGDVDPQAVPTLDDLENFDQLMRGGSTQVRGEGGGTSYVVRDDDSGLISDGREGYLSNLTFALCHEIARATGELPDAHWLARAVWDRFEVAADLSDGKWQFEHALDKARRLRERIDNGAVQIEVPAAAPDVGEQFNFVSADEGVDQLKTALREFLEYRAKVAHPDEVRHLLIRSPAGLGKTTNTIAHAVEYILKQKKIDPLSISVGMVENRTQPELDARMLLHVRTHNLAREIKGIISGEYERHERKVDIPIWRGRDHDAENGNAPCVLWEQAKLLQSQGYSVTGNLCQRRDAETGDQTNCAYFEKCEYISTRKKFGDFTIIMSAGLPYLGPTRLRLEPDPDEQTPPWETGFFRPTIDGRTFLIDETPIEHLRLAQELPIAVLDQMADPDLAQHIRDGLNSDEGLLTHLRSNKVAPVQLRRCARQCEDAENGNQIIVTPGEPSVADIEKRLQGKKLYPVSTILSRLADELSCGREGASYSLRKISADKMRAQGRHKFPFAHMPGIVMDATADPLILRQFMPGLEIAADIRVERNAFVTQVSEQTFSKHTLLNGPNAQEKRDEVRQFIQATAEKIGESVLVVTYKQLRVMWTGEEADPKVPSAPMLDVPNVDIAHFGGLRGLDQFKRHHAVIIVGRQEPKPVDIEEQARAIWYNHPEPIQTVPAGEGFPTREASVRVRNLGDFPVQRGATYHPDERVHALLAQTREAESLQAIDRLRLMHKDLQPMPDDEPKQVFLLCKIPLDGLVVDRLLSWDDLRAGGTKLERLLEACDERGLNAVPLTPKWLYANFPDMWSSEKATRRWLEAKPQSVNRDYSYWGAFDRFKLAGRGGHRQWSIIKNGADDPLSALEAAVGKEVE